MTPERWRQLEELFDSVKNLSPEERRSRLKDADSELRSAIAAVFAQEGSALEHPAWEEHATLLRTEIVVTPGTQLGPYKIDLQIGEGGMGAVFRAVDTRLGRAVALKMCREEFSERFQREARAIASLNHPHICSIYDVGPDYLVMELLDGETLAAKLKRAKPTIEQTLLWGRQIADALSAAHSKGIVHRDIKPGNVIVTSSGSVKVLDFGLAKRTPETTLDGSSVTMTLTEAGKVMGTPAYMAPEQAQGKEVDKRADVWAFGVLLYELLTGRRPFPGDSMQATLAAVLTREPDLSIVPARVRPVLRACLMKDPKERLSSIGDWRFLLGDDSLTAPSKPARGRWLPWSLVAALLVLGISGWLRFAAPPARPAVVRFGVPIPGGIGRDAMVALSPDGRSIAISAVEEGKFRLKIRTLDSLDTRLLPAADGARFPFWSPDGKQIGFFADGKLKTILVAGGEPVAIADVVPIILGATWGTQGVIVFSQARELYRVSEKGGVPERLYKPNLTVAFNPEFLPDGNHLLWVNMYEGVILGSLDGKPPARLLPDQSRTVYSPDGYLVFARQGRLTAQRFDLKTLKLVGEPLPLTRESVANDLLYPTLSAGRGGTLVYREKVPEQLVWVDRRGSIKEKVGPPEDWYNFRLSADQSKIAFAPVTSGPFNYDVTVFDIRRGTRERLTSEAKNSAVPVFSPDGKHIAFSSNRTGRYNPYITDGSNREKLVFDMQLAGGYPTDWSPDGKYLLYWGNEDLWIVPVDGKDKPYAIAKNRFEKNAGSFSPDGKWVAYSSNESGRYEIYLIPFPPLDGNRYTVSSQGGGSPAWRRDGKEIYFVAGDGRLTAVPVTIRGSDVQFGSAESLFPVDSSDFNRAYEPSLNGQRFLIAVPAAPGGAGVTVMLNWTQALGK
ncbi:MAG TPA: protein kinase [Candidatus Sulfopaludibacter sp.]|jgi:Tol biopolymer transport system component/predicted Ser/Thr protein kinase|nr:protein kinase [Candidatus Sulfopaludibacter sp.]